MVSIVIPCYNHERFLPDAIESALAQRRVNVEVVVVDDGSTDGSAAVAERYPVRLVRQPNRGLSAARNAGLRASRGDILIFLDADDRLYPEAAAAAVDAFTNSPSAMLTVGRCQLIDEDGRPLLTNLPRVTRDFYAELLLRNYIWTPAMAACRRAAFDAVGAFDPRFNASADYDLYLRIASHYDFVAHDVLVADYRQHQTSMSKNPVLMLESTLAVLRHQRAAARRSPDTWSAWRHGMRHWRDWYGEHLVQQFRRAIRTRGGISNAAWCAYHLLRLHPRMAACQLLRKLRNSIHRHPSTRERTVAWPSP
jgi:glycosyltransferase involved in cell wall biosynthesis